MKRFLDPTVMISRVEYNFQANHLPGDLELYTNRVRPWYAINNKNAAWVRIPYLTYAFPGERTSGVGDVTVGWGYILHENLEGRATASALVLELVVPTGSAAKRTGLDAYTGVLTGALVTNPTDLFPVYWIAAYKHSFDKTAAGNHIRALDLTVRTFHILPRGLYLLFIPSFFYDFESNFDVFSFGIGSGKAFTRRFSISAAYVQHISGRNTFNRGFSIGLNYLWGENKDN